MTIAAYPAQSEIRLEMREELHPRFAELAEGISEFTFAGIYLFREEHAYRVSALPTGRVAITGKDAHGTFFMLPFGLPDDRVLDELFERHGSLKAVSEPQAGALSAMGYEVTEDRDNFDYLYSRVELVNLAGRKFHKKKNLWRAFIRENECEARPLLEEYRDDALVVLEKWNQQHPEGGDYAAAREALREMEGLQLCGGIFYVDGTPVAYSLGEELARGSSYVIHFEKAVTGEAYKGIYQYTNQAFAAVLPDKYETINREQDLGHPGLRQSKESYNPVGFVKKFRARRRIGIEAPPRLTP